MSPTDAQESPPRDRTARLGRAAKPVAILAGAGLFAAALGRASQLDFVLDDAFISLRYSENLVRGEGLVFNAGERVEGFSNPLWVWLGALGLALGADGFQVLRALGVASFALSFPLVVYGAYRHKGEIATPTLVGLWTLPFLTMEGPAGFAGSGLETSAVGLAAIAMTVSAGSARRASWLIPLLLGQLRADLVPWILAWFALAALDALRRERWRLQACREPLLGLAVALSVCAAVALARYGYYGEWLPNTAVAKRPASLPWRAGVAYWRTLFSGSPYLGAYFAAALVGGIRAWRSASRADAPMRFASLIVGGHLIYVVIVGGDFMEYRFAYHVWPAVAFAAGMTVVDAWKRWRWLQLLPLALCAAWATRPHQLESAHLMQDLPDMHGCCGPPGVAMGEALGRSLPPGTHIATSMIGGIAYASGLPTLDILGLTDHEIARLPAHPRVWRGHQRSASMEMLRERGVELYIGHPVLCRCDRPCSEAGFRNVFVPVDQGLCLRTAYITETPARTAQLCARLDRLILAGVDCPGDTPSPGDTPGVAPSAPTRPENPPPNPIPAPSF